MMLNLNGNKFVGIIGGQCAGKTTAADAIKRVAPGICVIKFAGPLYQILRVLDMNKNRAFMQECGDLAKKYHQWGDDVFIKLFEHHLKQAQGAGYTQTMCDDVRRVKEAEALKEMGFRFLYIDAPEDIRRARAEAQGLEFLTDHNSENEVEQLRRYAHTIIIDNGDMSADMLRDAAALWYCNL